MTSVFQDPGNEVVQLQCYELYCEAHEIRRRCLSSVVRESWFLHAEFHPDYLSDPSLIHTSSLSCSVNNQLVVFANWVSLRGFSNS